MCADAIYKYYKLRIRDSTIQPMKMVRVFFCWYNQSTKGMSLWRREHMMRVQKYMSGDVNVRQIHSFHHG